MNALRHPLTGYVFAGLMALIGVIWNLSYKDARDVQQKILKQQNTLVLQVALIAKDVETMAEKVEGMGDRFTGKQAEAKDLQDQRMFNAILRRLTRIEAELDKRAGWMTEQGE